jgi:hypothetical protein
MCSLCVNWTETTKTMAIYGQDLKMLVANGDFQRLLATPFF